MECRMQYSLQATSTIQSPAEHLRTETLKRGTDKTAMVPRVTVVVRVIICVTMEEFNVRFE